MTYPKRAIIETDYTCNLKCLTCKLWHNNYRKLRREEKEIKLENICDVIKKLSFDNIERISFIGGEPFLKDYFLDAASYAKNMGFKVSVVTNGTLLNQSLVKKIVEYKIFDVIIFSVDGYGSNNDLIRGKGVYSNFEENLKSLFFEKKRTNSKKPNVMFYFTVSKYNFNFVEDDLEKLIKLNPSKIRVQLASSIDSRLIEETNKILEGIFLKHHSYNVDVGIEDIELLKLKNIVKKLKEKHKGRIVCEKIIDSSNTKCHFLFKDVVITPSGNILPCPMMTNFIIGNINSISISEAYRINYERISEIKNMAETGKIPICERCCVEKIIV